MTNIHDVLEVFSQEGQPLAIETVRKKAAMKSWLATKSILLELLYEGKISGIKTSKSWVFWGKGATGIPDILFRREEVTP